METTERGMGVPGEAMPSDTEIDTLLAGGKPSEGIPLGEELPDSPDHDKAVDTEAAPEGADPVITELQKAIGALTPEQKAALFPQQQPSAVEITVNGQKLQIPADKQVPLMQMGLNYSEKMRAFNQEKQNFEAKTQEIAQKEKYYGEIERVAKENPQWWEHVKASYQQRISGNTGNGEPAPTDSEMTPALRAALSKVTDLEQKLDSFLSEKTKEADMKRIQAEDAELEQHIDSFKKEHPEFDWMTTDETGLVLADRITVHAEKNGINNFRAAARDYLFNELIARKQVESKEKVKKDIQTGVRNGTVVTKPKPTGLTAPKNYQTRGYDDLALEGLRELG